MNNSITLYYFSGTGNSFSVANWIKNYAAEQDSEVELVNIAQIDRKSVRVPQNSMIGFVSPTHGFNYPPIMFHFLLRIPRARKNQAFLMNTRAGLKMHKIFLPGLSGMALFFAAIVLLIKGYKVVALRPVDLPSNWISFHPGVRTTVVESIYEHRKKGIKRFTDQLLQGRSDYRGLWALPIDIAITPIAVLYYLVGRFFLAKTFIANSNCNNCNRCIEQCPVQSIKLVDGRPFWKYTCESCMQCMNNCPERAIETAHGFAFGIWVLASSFVLYWIYLDLGFYNLVNSIGNDTIEYYVRLFFDSAIILACTFTAYRIIHWLMRFAFFERIIRYTSLTTWDFWRRYNVKRMKFWKGYHFPRFRNFQ